MPAPPRIRVPTADMDDSGYDQGLRMCVQGWSPGEGWGPAPTSGLDGQVRSDTLGADDVHGLALVLALVVQGDSQDPQRPRRQDQVAPVHRQLAPCETGTRSQRHGRGGRSLAFLGAADRASGPGRGLTEGRKDRAACYPRVQPGATGPKACRPGPR